MSAAEKVNDSEDYEEIIKNLGEKLPVPKGWKILVAVPRVDDRTEGGIYKSEEAVRIEEVGTIIGLVISMGDLAYSDKKKFPTEPWCKVGDYIMMRSYSGTRFKIEDGTELRLINDDTVEAVVEDPRGVEKVL